MEISYQIPFSTPAASASPHSQRGARDSGKTSSSGGHWSMSKTPFHLEGFYSSKALWQEEAYPRSFSSKQVSETQEFLPPFHRHPSKLASSRVMAGQGGPYGCISSRTHQQRVSKLSGVHVERPGLLLQSSPLWPLHGPSSVHRDGQFPSSMCQISRSELSGLPRRFCGLGTVEGRVPSEHPPTSGDSQKPRVPFKQGKIVPGSQSITYLARGRMGWVWPFYSPPRREGSKVKPCCEETSLFGVDRPRPMANIPRSPDICSSGLSSTWCKKEAFRSSNISFKSLQSGSSKPFCNRSLGMVVSTQQPYRLVSPSSGSTKSFDLDRCMSGRLGGGHDQLGRWVAGSWNSQDQLLHMNLLELKAVLLTLQSGLVPPNRSVRLFSDNSTTIIALNKKGSTKSLSVTLLVQEILQFCSNQMIQLHPHTIPGKLNVLADALSRNSTIPGEWELNPKDKEKILLAFPYLEVDLMATPFNAILEKFVSPFLHPKALAVDAWSQDWNQWKQIYLFPPQSQVARVLMSLRSFRGQMVLVLKDHHMQIPPFPPQVLKKTFPLSCPPRQKVRGVWSEDGSH